jgi:hypothetical protein
MTIERFRPWSADHLARLVVSQLGAFAVIVVVWFQTSGTGMVQRQLAWLGLGVVGLLVAGAGNALWLLRGLRRIQLAQRAVLPDAQRAQAARPAPSPPEAGAVSLLVSGASMTRYHLAGCSLVVGKETYGASRPGHESARRRPCEVCRP